MSAELEQRRRNVRVMDLLTESYLAHSRGDDAESRAKAEAAYECDASAAVVITGGMRIGEVPRPEEGWLAWTSYVDVNRKALADLEAEEKDPADG
jgi:hypothetical protein